MGEVPHPRRMGSKVWPVLHLEGRLNEILSKMTPYEKGLFAGVIIAGLVLSGGFVIVELTRGIPSHGLISYTAGVSAMWILQKSADALKLRATKESD